MTNYHHHPTANPLDGIIIAMMPSSARTNRPAARAPRLAGHHQTTHLGRLT